MAVISRTCGDRPLAPRASRWATPKRCCSSTTARARSANWTDSCTRACVPTTIRPLVRPSSPSPAEGAESCSRAVRRSVAGSVPVSSVIPCPSGSSSRRNATACCRASRSVGASNAPWRPASATNARARAATAVLPDPTSPWSNRTIGRDLARSAAIALTAAAWSSVSRAGPASGTRARTCSVRACSTTPTALRSRSSGTTTGSPSMSRRPRSRTTMPTCSASSSSKPSLRRAASRAANVPG